MLGCKSSAASRTHNAQLNKFHSGADLLLILAAANGREIVHLRRHTKTICKSYAAVRRLGSECRDQTWDPPAVER